MGFVSPLTRPSTSRPLMGPSAAPRDDLDAFCFAAVVLLKSLPFLLRFRDSLSSAFSGSTSRWWGCTRWGELARGDANTRFFLMLPPTSTVYCLSSSFLCSSIEALFFLPATVVTRSCEWVDGSEAVTVVDERRSLRDALRFLWLISLS
jgi:hypothetical protein